MAKASRITLPIVRVVIRCPVAIDSSTTFVAPIAGGLPGSDMNGAGRTTARWLTVTADDNDHCEVCGKSLGAGYLCDDCDDIVIERQHNPIEIAGDGFTFYFGAASGSSRKALRELQEPNVMLNYATKLNQPWYGIQRLFVDSGGYSFMKGKGEYETSDSAYLDYVDEHDPEIFALRDYPCEPEVLNEHDRTVEDHQDRTTDRHVAILDLLGDRSIDGQPLSVIQGWAVNDYLRHVDQLSDHGAITDYVGIGSVCRRGQAGHIRQVVLAVRDALPSSVDLHAFGVKSSVLRLPDVREALTSADSQSYEMRAQWGALHDFDAGGKTWQDSALEYLNQRRSLRRILTGTEDETTQQQRLIHATDGGTAALPTTDTSSGDGS